MKKKLSYDPESDVLYFNEGKKVSDSINQGNIYVEFSSDNKFVGVEVLEASETLSKILDYDVSKEMLENVMSVKLKMIPANNYTYLVFVIKMKKDGEEVRESININIPSNAVAPA